MDRALLFLSSGLLLTSFFLDLLPLSPPKVSHSLFVGFPVPLLNFFMSLWTVGFLLYSMTLLLLVKLIDIVHTFILMLFFTLSFNLSNRNNF